MAAALLMAIAVVSTLAFPVIGVIVAGVTILVQVCITAVRLAVAGSGLPKAARAVLSPDPVFSIHVAIHNEPPAMVARTLRALSAQTWPATRTEVVVVDNNTADPALWRPVEALCADLGPHFRFMHRMNVTGAKAGALNIALAQTRADASHVVTVDADYVVDPDFLAHAAQALERTGADYVQFPQAYLACTSVAAGVDAELEEYFRTHARMADGCEAVLLTGTLCVISRAAIESVGGWSGQTTSEDAEMGVRLCRKGFSGRFVNRVVGRGYLPLSLRDLERQRHRWAGGNLQTLIVHAPAILLGRDGMGWPRRAAILSQLSAWLNLSLLPAIVFMTMLSAGRDGAMATRLAAVAILLSSADMMARLVWRGVCDRTAPAVLAAALCNRIALAPVAALATVEVLIGRPMQFTVTDKSGAGTKPHALPLITLALFAAAAMVLPIALASGWLATVAALILMAPCPAACVTAQTLRRYRAVLSQAVGGAAA